MASVGKVFGLPENSRRPERAAAPGGGFNRFRFFLDRFLFSLIEIGRQSQGLASMAIEVLRRFDILNREVQRRFCLLGVLDLVLSFSFHIPNSAIRIRAERGT
jgi:hypothetical protein